MHACGSTLAWRSTSAIRTARGSAARTRTPTVCCGSTSRKAPTWACTAPTPSRPWPRRSTPGPARPSAGGHPPRPSTRRYGRLTQVLRRPLEPAQYAAEPYRKVLKRHGIEQSMSRKGNCLDNAPMESFFASLKKEHVHHARFRTRAEARAAVFEYIEVFYNRQRLHSGLGYRTPAEARAGMEGIDMRAAACCSDPTPPLLGRRSNRVRRGVL